MADYDTTPGAFVSPEHAAAIETGARFVDCIRRVLARGATPDVSNPVLCATLSFRPTGYSERVKTVILEVAFLKVRGGQTESFEHAFGIAQHIISAMPGYVSHQLHRCMEQPYKYLLLVQWRRVEDHTTGFRQSLEYQEWKRLLHHFYDPFPTVEHFEAVFEGRRAAASLD
jgi:heme-degrading monooxygenase HmoA